MKTASIVVPLAIAFAATGVSAQQIFRCPGNVYTNSQAEAQSRGCKAIEGGNVTVVQGTRVNGGAATSGVANVSAPGNAAAREAARVNAGDQKARDSEARGILEAELKKAEARQAELVKEFNNGEPDKLGPETRNHQKYLDRVAELKAAIERTENDIKGLQRELGRTNGGTASR